MIHSVANARRYKTLVVGAGGVGASTAYHLARDYHHARDGRRVLLVEQFELGHTLGSSHGGSRIIRYTHDTTDYAAQMPQTFQLWRDLEAESGAHLMQPTGGLYLGRHDGVFLRDCHSSLQALNFPYRDLDHTELAQEFPQFRLPDDWVGFWQEHTGILAATRCVLTMAAQAQRYGAELRDRTRLLELVPDGEGVRARLAGPGGEETVYADQAIVTAGPWAKQVLAPLLPFDLPLRVTHQQVAYFRTPEIEAYSVGRFPIFIATSAPHFYGFPIFERPGTIKVALEEEHREIDPNGPRPVNEELKQRLSTLMQQFFPGVDPEPEEIVVCLYTQTPTSDFIIDRHPDLPQLLIGAGFSGRGFKHTIAVGRLIADMAQNGPGAETASPFWTEKYRITRFAPAAARAET